MKLVSKKAAEIVSVKEWQDLIKVVNDNADAARADILKLAKAVRRPKASIILLGIAGVLMLELIVRQEQKIDDLDARLKRIEPSLVLVENEDDVEE